MADGKFTILGETGSGKTCYLLGLYYKMRSGIGGYTMGIDDVEKGDSLVIAFNRLRDKKLGENRFPNGTNEKMQYNLSLQYNLNTLKKFSWIDYPGSFLMPGNRDINDAQYKEVERDIKTSEVLFICVDGENLVEGDVEEKIEEVSTNSAFNITPYLADFKKNNGVLPPIAIIVTKCDLFQDSLTQEDFQTIIEKSFSPIFGTNKESYIAVIPVSLGKDIKDDGYKGKLKPLNIHLPIFFGVKVAFEKEISKIADNATQAQRNNPQIDNKISNLNQKIASLRRDIRDNEENIEQRKSWIYEEKNSWFFVNDGDIARWEDAITEFRRDINYKGNEISKLQIRIYDLRQQRSQNDSAISQKNDIPSMQNFWNMLDNELQGKTLIFRNGIWQ